MQISAATACKQLASSAAGPSPNTGPGSNSPDALVAAGAVPALVVLLSSPHVLVELAAAEALVGSANRPSNVHAIIDAGGVPALVSCLARQGGHSLGWGTLQLDCATKVLLSIAKSNAASTIAAGEPGFVGSLLRLLSSTNASVQTAALRVIHRLAANSKALQAAINAAGGVAAVSGLLVGPTLKGHEDTVPSLGNPQRVLSNRSAGSTWCRWQAGLAWSSLHTSYIAHGAGSVEWIQVNQHAGCSVLPPVN